MHEYLNRGSGLTEVCSIFPASLRQKQQQGNHDDDSLAAVFGVFFFGCIQESLKRALPDKKKWVIMFFVNLLNR